MPVDLPADPGADGAAPSVAGGAGRTLLVLGGGGAMGAYQAGACLALARAGIVADAMYGCSAGALNAAFLASEPSVRRAEELAVWWADPRTRGVLMPSAWARVRGLAVTATSGGRALYDERPLRRLIGQHVPAHDLSELVVPLAVTTTCLDCATARHHDRGPVGDVLAASCALPGIFRPVRLPDGHLHVDGGVVCGVPVEAAVAAAGPRDRVVVVDCGLAPVTSPPGACAARPGDGAVEQACGLPMRVGSRSYATPVESSRGVLDVVLRAFTVARAAANRASVAAVLADPRVNVVPHVADAWAAGLLEALPAGPRDGRRAGDLVDAGYRATAAWLSAGLLGKGNASGAVAV